MQVLVILNAHEHRIETQPDDIRAPETMTLWCETFPEHVPFQQVWAESSLHSATVSEIVNGYAAPPTEK